MAVAHRFKLTWRIFGAADDPCADSAPINVINTEVLKVAHVEEAQENENRHGQ